MDRVSERERERNFQFSHLIIAERVEDEEFCCSECIQR
jgi:hypothetical protein